MLTETLEVVRVSLYPSKQGENTIIKTIKIKILSGGRNSTLDPHEVMWQEFHIGYLI